MIFYFEVLLSASKTVSEHMRKHFGNLVSLLDVTTSPLFVTGPFKEDDAYSDVHFASTISLAAMYSPS